MKTKILVLFAAIVMMIAVSGCPGSTPVKETTASPLSENTTASAPAADSSAAETTALPASEVLIENHAFNPSVLTIKAGDSVTWTNKDTPAHSIVFADFESDLLKKGDSFTRVFDTAGSFDYVCGPHPDMKGTIEVQ